ncbi:MAG: hypothetical protein HZB66_01900 [Candidatus Aenigmarchaeota archaeon]|nr:hypothetical protein [Candidatus Aenigmarchaeota archaeon]
MYEYVIGVCRTEDISSQNQYWDLSRQHHGTGFPDSQRDGELIGQYLTVFISSEKPLTLEELQKKFPSISIVGFRPYSLYS